MKWQQVLQMDFGADRPLRERIDALFAQQRDTWPALRDGEAALEHLHRKTLRSAADTIVVQMNPARRASTTAETDAKSLAARPCFLCPENMPAEERGVEFADLVILPNPFPILPLHCTIAAREHRPQRLTGRVGLLLQLARQVGPDLAAFYNGPECGASAPDHFHFQAAKAREIPLLAQLPPMAAGPSVVAHSTFGRTMLIFTDTEQARMQSAIERAIAAFGTIAETVDEPLLNLVAHVVAGQYRAILFPRAAHRPACYFAEGADRIAVSPAVLEMSGILVTTEPADFARLDAATAQAIYQEISLDADYVQRLADTLPG